MCYRCVGWKSCPTTGQKHFRIAILIKNGGEVVRNSAISVERLEVFITTCKSNTPTGFWKTSQHTQVPYTRWPPIDVYISYTPAAHPHKLIFLAIFADDHLARNTPGTLRKKERWFTEERECHVARHSYLAKQGTERFILRLFCQSKLEL